MKDALVSLRREGKVRTTRNLSLVFKNILAFESGALEQSMK
jgi:hypothetical protein